MHELSLAENAIALIEEAARRECFRCVHRIWMEIGALACVEPEALRFAFQAASAGTCADGAELVIVPVAGEGECPACGLRTAATDTHVLCPGCGIRALTIVRGAEMRITDLDVE